MSATTQFISKTAEELLEDLAAELEIPDSRYEAAERSYRSVGSWLERPASVLSQFHPFLYPQGSFRLGTVTSPPTTRSTTTSTSSVS